MEFRIKEAREKAGYSQKELAEIIGVAPNTFHGYESGKHDPKSDLLIKIANACHVSTDFLLGNSENPETKTASPYTSEAMKLADDYDHQMDTWGQKAVRGVADLEVARYKEEQAKKAAEELPSEPEPEPVKVVKLPKTRRRGSMVEIKVYDEPAAAGLGNYLDDPAYRIEQYPEYILPSGTDFGIRIDGDSMEPKIHDGFTVFVESMPMINPGQIGIFVLNGKSYCKKLIVDHEKRQTRLKSINPKYEDIVIGEDDFFQTLGHVLGQWGPGSREDDFLDWKE